MGWLEVLVDPEKGVDGLVQIPACRFLVQPSLHEYGEILNDAGMLGSCIQDTSDPLWIGYSNEAAHNEESEPLFVIICDSMDRRDIAAYLEETVIPSLWKEHPVIEVWHHSFLSLWRQMLWETAWPGRREYECSLLDAAQRRLPVHEIPTLEVWEYQTRYQLLDSFHSKFAQAFAGYIEEKDGHDLFTPASTQCRLQVAADIIAPVAAKVIGG